MKPVIRSIVAILLGSVLAGVLIAVLESAGHLVYPPPPGLDPGDIEALKAAMADIPTGALLLVLLAWGVGTFAGGWLAAGIARRAPTVHAMIVGALFLAAGVMNMLMIPHPRWFWFPGVAVFLPAAFAGARLAAFGKTGGA